MDKIKTLFTGDYVAHWTEKFGEFFDLDPQGFALQRISVPTILSEEEVITHLKDKEAYLIGYDPVTEKTLKECPDLKLILSVRDGPDAGL